MKGPDRHPRFPLVYLGFLLSASLGPMFWTASVLARQVFRTQWAAIYYEDSADLQAMERRLRFSQVDNFCQHYSYSQDPAQVVLSPGLAAKIDGLLVKVCLTLGKWPQKGAGFRIFLLKDGKQVKQRQLVFQPYIQDTAPNLFGYGSLKAFYEPRTRTIFLSLADLDQRILAHEMTHFVLCESYATPPPASLQEDWAQYVESMID